MLAGGGQRAARGVNCLHLDMTIYTDPLYFSNPLVSTSHKYVPFVLLAFFEYKSVDLNILWGLGELSSMSNAMIRDFWHSR